MTALEANKARAEEIMREFDALPFEWRELEREHQDARFLRRIGMSIQNAKSMKGE